MPFTGFYQPIPELKPITPAVNPLQAEFHKMAQDFIENTQKQQQLNVAKQQAETARQEQDVARLNAQTQRETAVEKAKIEKQKAQEEIREREAEAKVQRAVLAAKAATPDMSDHEVQMMGADMMASFGYSKPLSEVRKHFSEQAEIYRKAENIKGYNQIKMALKESPLTQAEFDAIKDVDTTSLAPENRLIEERTGKVLAESAVKPMSDQQQVAARLALKQIPQAQAPRQPEPGMTPERYAQELNLINARGQTKGETVGGFSPEVEAGLLKFKGQPIPRQAILDLMTNPALTDKQVSRLKTLADQSSAITEEATAATKEPIDDEGALLEAAKSWILFNKLPAMGMGKGGVGFRTKALAKAAELRAASGDTAGAQLDRAASISSSKTALSNLEKTGAMVSAYASQAVLNGDIAIEQSKKVDRTGIPLLNKGIMAFKTGIAGDPEASKFSLAVKTFADEYAKVVAGSSGGAVTTDSARNHMESLITESQTPEQFEEVIKLAKLEMSNRIQELKASAKDIKAEIRNIGENVLPGKPKAPQYKEGDTRVLNGKTWTRINGEWK
jgi:hypothetical protein